MSRGFTFSKVAQSHDEYSNDCSNFFAELFPWDLKLQSKRFLEIRRSLQRISGHSSSIAFSRESNEHQNMYI